MTVEIHFANITKCVALAALVMTTGCASIVNGTTQIITVETGSGTGAITGASCKLQNDKGIYFVTTPGTVSVHRAYGDMSVLCKKDGFAEGKGSYKSSTKGMVAGNILIGGFIGIGVDAATGAAYDYPGSFVISMTQALEESLVPAAPAPAAATGAMQ